MANQYQRSPMAFIGGAVAALLALTIVSGCVKRPPAYNTATAVQKSTIMENDPYKKTNWINGPEFYCAPLQMCRMFLRARVLDGGAMVFYQMYVHDDAFKWRFYDKAHDRNGDLMNFVSLDRRTRTTNSAVKTIEIFVIDLDDAYMNRARTEGLDFKVTGTRGAKIFALPPHYVQGFMSVVDAQRF